MLMAAWLRDVVRVGSTIRTALAPCGTSMEGLRPSNVLLSITMVWPVTSLCSRYVFFGALDVNEEESTVLSQSSMSFSAACGVVSAGAVAAGSAAAAVAAGSAVKAVLVAASAVLGCP